MKYSTAVGRLRQIAADCERLKTWHTDLVGAYVYGEMLSNPEAIEWIPLAFTVDFPGASLPWMVEPPELLGLAQTLRLDKVQVSRHWRPAEEPVWNHRIRPVLQFWNRHDGPRDSALDALADGRVADLELENPSADEVNARVAEERERSLRYLRDISSRFWDQNWRRSHKGLGSYPEDHLHRAVEGYLDLLDSPLEGNVE